MQFTAEDPAFDGTNWYSYCGNNPVMFVDTNGLEYIAVSGGVYHDIPVDQRDGEGWFKYNFIEPAISKLREWAALEDGEEIKWIIADSGWTDTDKANFQIAVDQIAMENHANCPNITIMFINDVGDMVTYFNEKSGDRKYDKIEKVAFFCHGFSDGTVSLGYDYSDNYNKDLNLNKSNASFINNDSFDQANSVFYSCNTGTGDNSFAQMWSNKTNGTTWACAEKSYYGDMNAGENFFDKLRRAEYGFNSFGSQNYPISISKIDLNKFNSMRGN